MDILKRNLIKTGKFLSFFALIGVLYAYAMFQGGFVSWFLFYSVCAIVLLNFILWIYPLRFFEIERQLSKEVTHINEKVDVTVSLKKKFPFPVVFVSLNDIIPSGLFGEATDQVGTIYFFPSSKNLHYSYQILGEKRGEYTFQAVKLTNSDLFGFFRKDFVVETSNVLTVLPKIRPLRQWASFYNVDGDEVPVSSILKSETHSIAGVRDYIAGDRLSSIDWKVSARAGKLATKEFETRGGNGYLLVLENTTFHSLQSFERVIEFTASFLSYSFSDSVPVSLAVTSHPSPLTELGMDKIHYQQILKELARVENSSASSQLHRYFNLVHSMSSMIYVTSRFTAKERKMIDSALSDYKRLVLIYVTEKGKSREDLFELNIIKHQGAAVLIVQLREGEFTSAFKEEVPF